MKKKFTQIFLAPHCAATSHSFGTATGLEAYMFRWWAIGCGISLITENNYADESLDVRYEHLDEGKTEVQEGVNRMNYVHEFWKGKV